ncbi:cation:proton antiporter [Synechocystis sp. FACHB-383]|uniref:cation:proton antiporter n=1 Tax=Synechocystis sp. FACHB-383 TaxID=2692864 RepID=UPI0016840558|nr:cation:proton antiporter [Synechocystis sp. FACHB-383]MBD2655151.1 cation:proton antiporter [Synechocystis sp. FACHB-383]
MIEPYSDWAILAIFVFLYSLIAGRLSKTWLSDAIIFSGFGLLFGAFGLNLIQFNVTSENLKTIAELTLASILFTDAANANLSILRNSLRLPWRLLAVGLPLTIGLGFIAGQFLFPQFSPAEAGILAVMLAPTDAALGKAVVTNPQVPDNIREDLNVESGLNDGICVPLLFTLLAIANPDQTDTNNTASLLFNLFTQQIGIGALIGASFAVIGVQLRSFCLQRDWIADDWQPVLPIALAIACFASAQHLGGSGFIACFVGGLTLGGMIKKEKEDLLIAAEATGDALSLITWVIFGASVVPFVINELTWSAFFYAVLSLTIVRILPVFLAVLGMGLDRWSTLFVGWFGPRGLASIVFAVIVLDEKLPHSRDIGIIVACTILLSVLAHGFSATPLANWYGQWSRRQSAQP